MAEIATLETEATSQGKPSPAQLAPFRWTKETAAIARAKAIEAKQRNKAIQDEIDRAGTDLRGVALEQMNLIRGKLRHCQDATKRDKLTDTLLKIMDWLKDGDPAPKPTRSPKAGPIDPIV